MKRIFAVLYFSLLFVLVLGLSAFGSVSTAHASTQTVSLSTTVLSYLLFSITAGSTVALGSLTPGTPIAAPSGGTVASVTTNSANGYTLGLSDGSDTDSAMVNADTTTYIADYVGTITTPTTWTGTGLGATLFAADTSKEAKWGTGTAYDDANNKYAGIPSIATTAHTVTGYHAGADTSSWAFKLDVPNGQKTGTYSGNVTMTATAVLS